MCGKKIFSDSFGLQHCLIPVVLFYGMFIFATLVFAGTTITPQAGTSANSQALSEKLKEQWGIELTAIRLTAANHMVDFRYRVLDVEKSGPLFKRQTKPYLIHQQSGKVLAVPNTAKVGSLRNSNMPKQGRIYWMFFGNNGVVKNGDKVSVVIGDFRADNLIVE